MKPLACALVLVLLFFASAQSARASAPATGNTRAAQALALRLLERWNGSRFMRQFPADRAYCVYYDTTAEGTPRFACEWRFRLLADRSYRCLQAIVNKTLWQYRHSWVRCVGPFTPPTVA